jgi:hypothetical protein
VLGNAGVVDWAATADDEVVLCAAETTLSTWPSLAADGFRLHRRGVGAAVAKAIQTMRKKIKEFTACILVIGGGSKDSEGEGRLVIKNDSAD